MSIEDAALPPIEGVDQAMGLASVGSNQAVYRRLLGLFCQVHRQDAVRIAEACQRGEAEQAIRLAHQLRGSASTLGLRTLAQDCRAFESALREEDLPEDIEARRQVLALTLARLIEGIRDALAMPAA